MKNIFITGVSGYFGYKLISLFDQKNEVESIIGIDVKAPTYTSKKLEFIRHDVRDDMYPILSKKGIDCAIHAAYIIPPLHNKALMEDININGTKNFLNSCAKAGIKQLLYCSSTTAYGFHKDNPSVLTEDSPLRGNDDFTYSKNKKELEFVCKEFKDAHPDICFTIIRPCFVIGPGFDNTLARHLKRKIVFMPRDTVSFQYVHEDDLVEIIYQLLLNKKDGVYNIAADGTMTFDEMIEILGNWPLKLPPSIMRPLNSIMWSLRVTFITEFPSPALNMVRYPWIASNEKIKKELNYKFKYTTKDAFKDFARHVKATKTRRFF
ncbi:MAG: NAD-dependent epimerase/dehydratase family protein [Deltaproteobacteria bacterium]|nr:NAD-dependent epimerase/dehydratase family protein [Deltaproteobacteria bacterium]